MQFKLTEHEGVLIEKGSENINTQMDRVDGLTLLSYNGKKLVIVTCYKNTIQAINYETGEIEWKIEKEQIDGKVIQPLGVCHDDVGHLLVADGYNKRVLVVSADGKIKQKLLDLPGHTYYVGFDVTLQKLIVQYYKEQ